MRRFITSLVFLLSALPARPQASAIPNLALDASPAETDMIEIRKSGDARDKRTTRSTFFSSSKSCPANQVVASPNGTSGLLACRNLTSTDIPALAYVTSVSGPTGIIWSGSTALSGTWASQSAGFGLFAPTGTSGTPTFRALAFGDLPTVATGRLYGSVSASTAAPGSVTVSTGLNLSTSGVLTATGSGTVTSVALTAPAWLTVGGSPVTTSGTLALTAATGQTSGRVIGTCGAGTSVSLCALVAGDIPTISAATQLSGTLAAAQFPALTGAVTTSAGSLATTLASSLTITTPVLNGPTIGTAGTAGSAQIKTAGTAPSVSCTGTGTGGTATLAGTDLASIITITAGTSAGSSGTCTITFNATFTNPAICVAGLAGGTGAWQATSSVIYTSPSATAPQFTWTDNNNTVLTGLTNGSTYLIEVICIKR